jgi:hypothetical protein
MTSYEYGFASDCHSPDEGQQLRPDSSYGDIYNLGHLTGQ